MINVRVWRWDSLPDNMQAEVMGEPEINATAPDEATLREYLVQAWARVHGEVRGPGDFALQDEGLVTHP